MSKIPLVAVDNVVKRYGAVTAVERTSFEIAAGEFLAIMGSSGCGKTTTLRMLAGLEAPSEGEIRIEGHRMNDLPPWQRETPLVWQSLALFPFLTVVENVEFGLRMRKVPAAERRKRALGWLDRMGLSEFTNRNIAQLSGGQRQRVALARSLVTEPKILLLDEPLSALDAHLKVRMQAVLTELQEELGITFVYVTHSQSEAFSMADRVIIMSRGRIEQIGRPVDIYRTPRNRFVAEFLGSSNIFEGTVHRIADATVSVQTASASFETPVNPQRSVSAGDQIRFVVPEDRIQISLAHPQPGANVMVGRIIGEEFVGAAVRVYVETDERQEIKVLVPDMTFRENHVRRGGRIGLSWKTESAYVLPEG
ncbi:ABC transporter ATP-binding protein [Microvirga sp. VF16]|uniref:ABC transporter ATP-binding protein n=1 Tax=Microvirga sp. VF16 TaxID=2807101 RepID=UPI00193D4EF4|nr:ABC transporter ATP-binding protein [Microvirga sp. VF16]QRM35901.1 ABC transporter ATP-binding protein [Microvirga sp. VF16]